MSVRDLLMIPASYGLGCFVTGYYLVRWRTGRDIRTLCSGSAGARNVGRVLGRWGFLVTLTIDILKGAIVVIAGRLLGVSLTAAVLTLPAVAAGHVFPVQLQFRGGKGIAVSLGALSVLDYRIAAVWIGAFVVLFLCCRSYMLSGMISVLLIPVTGAVLGLPASVLFGLILLVALIVFAHRNNIAGLFNGNRPVDLTGGPGGRDD